MKVGGPGKIQTPSVKKAKGGKSTGSSEFSSHISDTPAASSGGGVASAGPINSVNSLLGLQEVGDATEGRSKGLAYGKDLLDRLEDIRRGLLLGTIPVNRLRSLAEALKNRKDQFNDPVLKTVLDEIELRARVELAKLEVDM